MIIDGHAHVGGALCTEKGILKYLAENKIDKIVLCPGEHFKSKNNYFPIFSDFFKNEKIGYISNKFMKFFVNVKRGTTNLDNQNIFISKLSKKYNDKIFHAYWVNPLDYNCLEKMEEFYKKNKFKMIKMHQCWTDFDIYNVKFGLISDFAGKNNIPIFIHLRSKAQSIKFAEFVNNNKNTNFIIAHLIGFNDICDNITQNNVYFDISAPFLITKTTLEKVFNKFGASKILFGSDLPYGKNNFEVNKERILSLNISSEEKKMIFRTNMLKLLNI